MTFEQFVAKVEDWTSRLTPAQARSATENLLEMGIVNLPPGISAAQVLAAMASGAPIVALSAPSATAPVPEPMPRPAVCSAAKGAPTAEPVTATARRGSYPRNAAAKARALVRQQLADGPRPASQIEAAAQAAAIPARSLIAAADALGVRTQRGQWWLPG